ncbi:MULTISPECIES: sensor histidine kinase [Catenuloplanes]|uniref:histidine kinase n=1 Tax=Catenuloplanes niger TaxID=587534 RepID=A0AAE3ZW28_9ACTN|nr:HAMP domain-containing sensor histidine kinase [Catenuloplanes niger]MDR7326866.1 two-component system sensor histidine kinase VanS [Catenuloplanes niger]
MSVRLKLTLSYAGFLMVAGALLLAVVWVFLLRYVPQPPAWSPRVGPHSPTRYELLHAFAPRAAVVAGFLLVFGLVGGWILAGRMLAPLSRITEAARTAATGSLAHRIRLPGRADEFRELADAFDTMLGRLEAHVDEQRRFAANASHELRTPLAITQAMLEVAREHPARVDGDLIGRLHVVNARAIGLTEALLLLSRADRRSFGRERVDLSLAAEEAVETLLPLAGAHGVAVEVAGDVVHVTGSPSLLLQLTMNLVQNAIVHNAPAGGFVRVVTRAGAGRAVLTVENGGEVLAPEVIPTLTEPFRRGAERTRAGHAGAGLGLAIVAAVVRAHDGTLTLVPRAAGGLRVVVRLPTAG